MVRALTLQTRNLHSNTIIKAREITTLNKTINWIKILSEDLLLTMMDKVIRLIVKEEVVQVSTSKMSRMFWVVHFIKRSNQLALATWNRETRRWKMHTRMLSQKARVWELLEDLTIRLQFFSTARIISSKISHNSLLSMGKEIYQQEVVAALVVRVVIHLSMEHMVTSSHSAWVLNTASTNTQLKETLELISIATIIQIALTLEHNLRSMLAQKVPMVQPTVWSPRARSTQWVVVSRSQQSFPKEQTTQSWHCINQRRKSEDSATTARMVWLNSKETIIS